MKGGDEHRWPVATLVVLAPPVVPASSAARAQVESRC